MTARCCYDVAGVTARCCYDVAGVTALCHHMRTYMTAFCRYVMPARKISTACLSIWVFCVAVVFRCRSPQNHRYFLWEILARWFFAFAHRKTTDTIWSKIWDWFFPWNFPGGRSAISSATKTFFYFNVICCNNRNRITAVFKMSSK